MSSGLDSNQLWFSEEYKDCPTMIDIKAHWVMGNDHHFNKDDMWEGQFILESDGWFEGIVIDPLSPYLNDRFVFGVYTPDKNIHLLKVTPSDISDPFVFRGKKTDEGYDGKFAAIDEFGEFTLGSSLIVTKKSEKQSYKEILSRINAWKAMMVGDQNSFLYENIVKMRDEMIRILKRDQQEDPFTYEEIEDIEKIWEPIIEEQSAQMADEFTKRLIKTYKEFKDEDDDLPF